MDQKTFTDACAILTGWINTVNITGSELPFTSYNQTSETLLARAEQIRNGLQNGVVPSDEIVQRFIEDVLIYDKTAYNLYYGS